MKLASTVGCLFRFHVGRWKAFALACRGGGVRAGGGRDHRSEGEEGFAHVESPVHGNPTGIARSLGALASLALRRRLSAGLPLSRALGPTITPRCNLAVGDRQQRAIPSDEERRTFGETHFAGRHWRVDLGAYLKLLSPPSTIQLRQFLENLSC